MSKVRVSDEPIYWGLFGFGGMVMAFALPAILLLMILQGFGVDCFNIFNLLSHWWGAGAIAVIVCATLWHCMHRIYHSLHDVLIHTTRLHHYVLYGIAFAGSVITCMMCLGWYYFILKIAHFL